MKNKINILHFNYETEFNGKKYKKGYAYKLDMSEVDIKRLLRMGCIYAGKDAKYYKEEVKPAQVKKVVEEKPTEIKKQEVEKDVDNKNIEQAKVQTGSTDSTKSFK